jgi:hypothetical protein
MVFLEGHALLPYRCFAMPSSICRCTPKRCAIEHSGASQHVPAARAGAQSGCQLGEQRRVVGRLGALAVVARAPARDERLRERIAGERRAQIVGSPSGEVLELQARERDDRRQDPDHGLQDDAAVARQRPPHGLLVRRTITRPKPPPRLGQIPVPTPQHMRTASETEEARTITMLTTTLPARSPANACTRIATTKIATRNANASMAHAALMAYSAFLRESGSSRAMLHEMMSTSPRIGRIRRTTARWIVGVAVMGERVSTAPDGAYAERRCRGTPAG